MKNKRFYFAILLVFLLIIYSCKKEINSPETNSIELISYKSNGCISTSKLVNLGKVTDDAIIETNYVNGKLEVNIKFTTHCSAEMKDSLVIGAKKIDIYLEDINKNGSRCICPHKEEFIFNINEVKEIEIVFNYNAYASDRYYTIADTTIHIN